MIFRIDVYTAPAACAGRVGDPLGQSVRNQILEMGADVGGVSSVRIFLIDAQATRDQMLHAARALLADPVVERAELVETTGSLNGHSRIEIHLKPGVMDPVAASTQTALKDLGIDVREVRTGRAFVLEKHIDRTQLASIASRVLANGVIELVHFEPYIPTEFERGHEGAFQLRHVKLLDLNDEQLRKLSREGHLFLSLTEMKAVQDYFRAQGREPTDIELETIAQTWSEHCVHKTLKSSVKVQVKDESGRTIGQRHYGNLIRDTIFASTIKLMERKPGFCLSVFKDNAGVIAFDDVDAVCFKVETHNHPSAIEPYGGSATGIGGCIRDVMGTGLAAKPVANTDVFCVAYPEGDPSIANRQSPIVDLPKGVIHPKRILQQIVAGVRDYGNRMGIPTVNGAVYFHPNYIGNPLVFCGCVGLIPRDKIHKQARAGDAIVVMGGRTGRDGIHGATFSSAELTDTHADEFSHAVQIGNAITQKKMLDVILQARDRGLFTAITDCGAGGLSSAVGEMGEKIGADVKLETVPLKYAGLRYDEIWISEAQERMVLAVPPEHVEELLKLSAQEDVEATVIGTFGTKDRQLILNYRGHEVGRLSMEFLHEGIPMPTRTAVVTEPRNASFQPMPPLQGKSSDFKTRLLTALAHPNVSSKHWIIRQYDHEVQGGSVVKPLIGPMQIGPSDASVIRPKLTSRKGVVIGCGLAPHVRDPYWMAVAAIDEAIRNVVCVGADPDRVAILDNFCWPSVDDEITMGTLVRACEACRDVALAFGVPFISGKDSLHNQFTNSETGQVIRIPNTLLISALGVIDDVCTCITMDLKQPDNRLVLVEAKDPCNLSMLARTHRLVAGAITAGEVHSAHDVSDGGLAVAAAEMCIASGLGLVLECEPNFDERPGCYLLELSDQADVESLRRQASTFADIIGIGRVRQEPMLRLPSLGDVSIEQLTTAWRGTLDW